MYDTSDMWSSNARADRQLDSRCSYPSCCTVRHSFLPLDAVRKRGLCCRPVSVRPSTPSVCLSVTFVYCMHRLKISSNLNNQQKLQWVWLRPKILGWLLKH